MRFVWVVLFVASTAAAEPDRKDPNAALGLSIGTAAAGIGLIVTGAEIPEFVHTDPARTAWEASLVGVGTVTFLVAPSVGRIFGGAPLWNRGLRLKLIGLGIAASSVPAVLLVADATGSLHTTALMSVIAWVGLPLVTVGGIGIVTGTTIELATTPSAVRRVNRELDATLTIAPIATRDGVAPGISLVGQF